MFTTHIMTITCTCRPVPLNVCTTCTIYVHVGNIVYNCFLNSACWTDTISHRTDTNIGAYMYVTRIHVQLGGCNRHLHPSWFTVLDRKWDNIAINKQATFEPMWCLNDQVLLAHKANASFGKSQDLPPWGAYKGNGGGGYRCHWHTTLQQLSKHVGIVCNLAGMRAVPQMDKGGRSICKVDKPHLVIQTW